MGSTGSPFHTTKATSRVGRSSITHCLTPRNFLRVRLLEQAWQTRDTIFGRDPAIATALVDADLRKNANERDKDGNNLDTASRALRQCLSAARGLVSDFHETLPLTKIIIPVVVSNAQLWTCRLTDDNEINVEATDYVRVRAPGTGGLLIHVMGLTRFERFADQVAGLQQDGGFVEADEAAD